MSTALKWMFSIRHKINGISPISDFKFFVCCILKDIRVSNDAKSYFAWINGQSAIFNNIITANTGASYYFYKA